MQTAVSFREDDSEWSFRFPYTYINRDFPAFWRLPCPSPTVLTVTWTPRWCCVWDTRRAKGVMTLFGEIKGTVVSLILGINCHIVIFSLVPLILLIFGGLFSQRCWFSYTLSIFPTNDGPESGSCFCFITRGPEGRWFSVAPCTWLFLEDTEETTLPETNIKSPWKSMLGRWTSLLACPYF